MHFFFLFQSALFFPCNLLVFSCILLKNYINSSVTHALSLAIFLNFIFLYPFFFLSLLVTLNHQPKS